METHSNINFPKSVYFLQDLVTQKRRELPFIVRTRDKLESFDQEPIVPEGKILYIDEEVDIDVVRFKVLPFHDEDGELSRRGAEFMNLYDEFKGEEFYMPLNCPGRFKFVGYPGRRQRYASVSQIIEDKPRYITSNIDVMAVPPRDYSADCPEIVPSGTVIEPKEVITSKNSRYLMCLDTSKNCYFLRENSNVNFTAVPDDREYSMSDLNRSDILLPTVIQFIPGTISPNKVVLFSDIMASNNLVITTAPLEIIAIKRHKILLAKARQSDDRCFVTLLMPISLCEKFHVQMAEFESSKDKSGYIKQKFGGRRRDNAFVRNKMYLLQTSDTLVCWLQSPRQRARRVRYIDSSDSDDDYEEPKTPDALTEEAPPIPAEVDQKSQFLKDRTIFFDSEKKPNAKKFPTAQPAKPRSLTSIEAFRTPSHQCPIFKDSSDSNDYYEEPKTPDALNEEVPPIPVRKPRGNVGSIIYEVVLPPQRVIHDKDVLQKLRDRARLGFDKVHCEIKRAAERFRHRRSKQNKPYEETYINTKLKRLPPIPNRPLPPLPPDVEGATSTTTYAGNKEMQENYDYVDVGEQIRIVENKTVHEETNLTKKTAKVNPVSPLQIKINTEVNLNKNRETWRPLERSSSRANETRQDKTPPPTPHSAPVSSTRFNDPPQLGAVSRVGENRFSQVIDADFFSFSVAQTVECLMYCGMDDLAGLCEEQKLDGEFFQSTDETEVRELLKLSGIQLLKLKKIYKGWRPKFN